MPKLSWTVLPITLLCWIYAWTLYDQSSQPLFDSHDSQPSPLLDLKHVKRSEDAMEMGSNPNNLFYFVQISDLHISSFKKKSLNHLNVFLKSFLPAINPSFVVVTGDLTDAKDEWMVSSAQLIDEWKSYYDTLKSHGILDKANFWWDQRGNHDCFDVPSWESEQNWFRNFSSVKTESYGFQHERPFGTYSFIGLDACPIHGPSRPFNFFGYFDTVDMNSLQEKLEKYAPNSNHTFLLNHYPIGMVITGVSSAGLDFDTLSQHLSMLLCGHLHKFVAGIGEIMHLRHRHDLMELELSDMKAHGSYRIMAVDHDIISFLDSSVIHDNSHHFKTERINLDPIVLITNPKDARYILEDKEPVHRILKSTHIRILAFSPKSKIERISVFIDDLPHEESIVYSGNDEIPLWTVKWDPKKYTGKTHKMTVKAWDSLSREGSQTILFRSDGKPVDLDITPGLLLMTPKYYYWFKVLFLLVYLLITVFLLLIPKFISLYLHKTHRYHKWRIGYSKFLVDLDKPQMLQLPDSGFLQRQYALLWLRLRLIHVDFKFFAHATFFRLITFASMAATFYPIIFYVLYVTIGPFFVGELIPSSVRNGNYQGLGYFYLYGIYIENHWVPLPDTWVFGFFELVYLVGPLIIYLSFCITPPEQLYSLQPPASQLNNTNRNMFWFPQVHNRRKYPLHRRIGVRITVAVLAFYQLVNVFFIGLYYGPISVLISPGKTWFVLWGCYALYKHRWSSDGHEIDLQEDDTDKRGPYPFFSFIRSSMKRKKTNLHNE